MDGMDMNSASTPWNSNLSYAIGWSIVLAVPIVLLTGRHIIHRVSHMNVTKKRQCHSSVKSKGDGLEESDGEEEHCSRSRVDIPTRQESSKRWSYSRVENWIVNKASATLYLGSFAHFIVGATLLALIFLAALAALLLSDADLLLNSNRAGFLGLSCIPFLFAFAGKNSIISYMTGISHHRINQIHRFLGLCLFILISVHMGCMIHVWLPWKFLMAEQLSTTKVRFGLSTYTTLCLIVLTSAWPVRRWAYETFVVSHTLFLVFLVLVGFHTPYAMRFTVTGIFCYVLNVLTGWFVKTHTALAQATVFQDRLTRLRMDRPMPHAPGQHIYVCVPSISLIQWHPFTISSGDQNSFTVHARAVGGFTRSLCRWPENTQKRVILAGPYGEGVQVGRELNSHKVLFLAAGSGLAYVIPILMDLLQARRFQKTSNCAVEVVWCVRDPDEVQWFQEELEVILDAAQGYLDTPEKDKEDIELISAEISETPIRILIHHTALASCDQESIMVQAPAVPTSPVGHISATGVAAPSTVTTAETALNAPFAGDERVEWVKSRLNVIEYTRRQIEETPREKILEIVGCGPALMLAELHNVVAATEALSGCRVNLHTERFHI